MGTYIYGCDRCQNVCLRNSAWLAADLPVNVKVATKADAFDLSALLHMDKPYFETRIWPHMFYMSSEDLWRWKMNVSRAMGNTRDSMYTNDLIRAFEENDDERVQSMCAWALGRIGDKKAKSALRVSYSKNVVSECADEIIEKKSEKFQKIVIRGGHNSEAAL